MRAERNECWIEVRGVRDPQYLAYYARKQASEVDALAACELVVDRVVSGAKGPLFSAHLTLHRNGQETSIDELNPDAYLAVRNAFHIARMWLQEHGAERVEAVP